ncbi:peptidase inhibitor family I36 protein [Actinoplanes derwentensis]|uniref:Peptidase inhibitor family I36 n=1 Tax=Actinoplanes derwentensis TaxID=113562 RepID=A0A1H1XN89_9ACTN|nr:peptidase inhibitor family I36 protein [Actinoplanes derwentensis]GID87713.1 hypothetical protein Ade03nite_66370 [Actinoplanes derwentensis]SDT10652.1 hypothetical protein SAMN04489716_2524 [Actinoplanes derwentensis]
MKKRMVAAAAAAVAASLVALPAPAQAAYACKNGEVCIYQNVNLTGSVLIVYSGVHNFLPDWHFYNGDAANDAASSIINNTDTNVRVTADFNAQGASTWLLSGQRINFDGLGGRLANDTMSFISVA